MTAAIGAADGPHPGHAPAFERFAAAGKSIVPGRLFERIVMRLYNIG